MDESLILNHWSVFSLFPIISFWNLYGVQNDLLMLTMIMMGNSAMQIDL